jgi:galactose mutarotase-like enzyme
MDAWAPPGRYKVALEEEQLDSLTVEAWRKTSVILQIASAGATDYLCLDPMELRDALLRDGDDGIDPAMPVPGARLREVLKLR